MTSLERLFFIVHSLTKSEKRYFRLTIELQKGTKDYVILFDFIEKGKVFDENLVQKINRLFPGSKIESARKHLYKVLMKSLRQFESERNIDSKLMNLLQDSRILFDKGLADLSLSKLDKLKKLAIKHEKFLFYIMAAKEQIKYLIRLQFVGINELDLIEKQGKIQNLLEQEIQSSAHASVFEILLLRYWKEGVVRNQKQVANLNDLVLEEHHILTNHRLNSFHSQQLHLNFQSTYFAMVGEPKESLKVYYKLEKLFQKNMLVWEDDPMYYIHLIDGVLSDLRFTENYDAMRYFISCLKNIKSTSESLKTLIKHKIMGHQLSSLIDMKNMDKATLVAKQFETSIERELNIIPVKMRLWSLFILARTYYASQNYTKAIKYLNRVLNNPIGVRKSSLMVLCQLMILQIYTLQGKYDYLEYATRSVERKFRMEQKLHSIERLIIKIIKRKIAYKPINDLYRELNELRENPFERRIIRDLLIDDWINNINQNHSSIR